MFHAPMGRFQLELIYYFTFIFHRQLTVQTVNCPRQGREITSTPTRPVENVITTKGLQDRNIQILDGMTVEIKVKQ